MKKVAILFLSVLVLTFAACDGGSNVSTSSKPESSSTIAEKEETDQSPNNDETSPATDTNDEANMSELDEVGLPKMTQKNQERYNQYIQPFVAASVFLRNFNESEAKSFHANRVYSCIVKPTEFQSVEQNTVEQAVAKYFPVTSEQMRVLSGINDYNATVGTYDVPPYAETNSPRGVITDCEEVNGNLAIACDWYITEYTDTPSGTYKLYGTAKIVIEPLTGKFLSNEVNVK